MKRDVILVILLLFTMSLTLAETACDLDIKLLNQDPYPAVPGDYVKLVFQVDGLDSPNCNDMTFELLSDYPIEFNPGEDGFRTFKKVDYIKDYETSLLIPYEIRIDEDALDGVNPIEVRVQSKNDAPITKTFNIKIKDVRADFEIYVKDYNYNMNEMTIEVLNIGDSDIEALTMEIPKQDSIEVKGSNRVVVGDLDSNEYTSADFETILSTGKFKVNLIYSDAINTRRRVEKTVVFDSSYFTNRKANEKTTSMQTYLLLVAVLLLLIYWIFKKIKKSRNNNNKK